MGGGGEKGGFGLEQLGSSHYLMPDWQVQSQSYLFPPTHPQLPSWLQINAYCLKGLHSSLEALPDLLGGEFGKGGLVIAAEEGMSSLANAFKEAKRISESALLPIVDKVANDVKTKAKIAQNAFEVVVMGVMDLVEEVGATMGGLGGGGGTSTALPTSVDLSQSSAEGAEVVGEVEADEKLPEGADGDNKEEEENVDKVEPTGTGGSV